MFTHVPLMIVPFVLFNMALAGLSFTATADPWAVELFSVTMVSGGVWTMTMGDALVAFTLVLLFFEIMKSTRTSNVSVVDHLLSTFVFIAFLVEFLLVPGAARSLFFTLMVISLIDVVAGFSISIRSAGRDVSIG